MYKTILNTDIQLFINNNLNSNIADLLLKGIPFKDIDPKLIIEQLEAKKRAVKKLPTWFNTDNIYYPNKLNIEQSSSEQTAQYKSQLISGNSLIDLTGGFGVDSYYFSKRVDQIVHCEINEELSEITKHNYNHLGISNINCIPQNGIDTLKQLDRTFDWIYIDPSRRNDDKKKVFLLSDCTPNIKVFQDLFLKYATLIMIKTSPLLDLTATIKDLRFVKSVHVIAVNNDMKELLWIIEKGYVEPIQIFTVNIIKNKSQQFKFTLEEEEDANTEFHAPLNYLYEPNSAVLKAGGFKSIAHQLNLKKLHQHSHLYTSNDLVEFPGRRFNIESVIPFHKKTFAKTKISKANISTRNFPLSVHDIKKKLKILDGGLNYLFFTTNMKNEKIIILCSKV